MDKIAYKELIDELFKLKEEKFELYFNYLTKYISSYNHLNNNTRNKLQIMFNKYLQSYKVYKNIINYIGYNKKLINYDNAAYILDLLDERYEEIIIYTFNMLQEFDDAWSMKQDYKFNPKDNNIFLNNNDLKKYKNYIKGFNIDNVANFLINNDMYTPLSFEDTYNNIKIINCSLDDYIIYSGINDNGEVIVPKINDELSTLINIHELTHKALILNQDIINNNTIVNSEILPIFYELLFKKENKFCKQIIHENEIAIKLLNDYHNEPFNEQIHKLKRII